MQVEDREVEAELGISSTDIAKRMGTTVDAYPAPVEECMFGRDAETTGGKRGKFQVVKDAESLPWDGISTQAPVIDESWFR